MFVHIYSREFFVLRQSISICSCLSCNSLCRSSLPQTHRSPSFCLLSAGIKGRCQHTLQDLFLMHLSTNRIWILLFERNVYARVFFIPLPQSVFVFQLEPDTGYYKYCEPPFSTGNCFCAQTVIIA